MNRENEMQYFSKTFKTLMCLDLICSLIGGIEEIILFLDNATNKKNKYDIEIKNSLYSS